MIWDQLGLVLWFLIAVFESFQHLRALRALRRMKASNDGLVNVILRLHRKLEITQLVAESWQRRAQGNATRATEDQEAQK